MGRNSELETGVENSMTPGNGNGGATLAFSSTRYTPMSQLDNLMPNQNGMGENDLQRRMMGINSSANGQSTGNFDKSLWIRSAQPTATYNYSQG